MIDRLHREVERHELYDRSQSAHRRAGAHSGKSVLGNGCVDNATGSEFFEQSLGHLVRALILGNFLAHHEDPVVAPHFLGHGVSQGFAHGDGGGRRAFWRCGIGSGLRLVVLRDGRLIRLIASDVFAFAWFVSNRCFWAFSLHEFVCLDLGLLCRRLWRRTTRVLVFTSHNGDHGADLDAFGAFGNHDLANGPFIDRFEFHRRLIGFDLGQDVAGLDRVAFLDQPLGELAFFHCRRKRGHLDFDCHQYGSTNTSV